MSSVNASIVKEKAESPDKDIRYMALSDLNNDLQKENCKITEADQRQLYEIVLRLLDDVSADVQGMAVKCLQPLIKRISERECESLVEKLSGMMLAGKQEQRDIAGVALKTVVTEMPADKAVGPIRKLTPKLVAGAGDKSSDVQSESLEVLNEVLKRFGPYTTEEHPRMQAVITAQLAAGKANVKKRSVACAASLSVHTKDALFAELVAGITAAVEKASAEASRTYIQTLSAISRTAGHRLGRSLAVIVPLLHQSYERLGENEDEVRENILQAFESFAVRCPQEITPFVDTIVALSKEALAYDPNYNYDDEEEMGAIQTQDVEERFAATSDEEEVESDDEGQDYSDEEDLSWKCRKAAAKTLASLINARPDLLDKFCQQLSSTADYTLVDRFKEREDSVKLEVFNAFNALVKQSVVSSASGVRQRDEVKYLREVLGRIVKRLALVLDSKESREIKSRIGALQVLTELATVLQGGLQHYANILVPAAAVALTDSKHSNSNLKIEALTFLRVLLSTHEPSNFAPLAYRVLPGVLSAVDDKYYKITAEALRVCGELVPVVAALKETSPADYPKFTKDLFDGVLRRLETQDIDQDVKEAAIQAMGRVVSVLGDQITAQLGRVLSILLDRMNNEITRLTATKTLAVIAGSSLHIDITPVLGDAMPALASFLRKANRPLRQAALTTLYTIVSTTKAIPSAMFGPILDESAPLINDSDLHLAHLALDLAVASLKAEPSTRAKLEEVVLPRTLELVQSSLLQGQALESALRLLATLVPVTGYDKLLGSLLASSTSGKAAAKQSNASLAQAVAAITIAATPAQRNATVTKFLGDLRTASSDQARVIALLCLGEIGRRVDVSTVQDGVDQLVQECFESASEEVKSAASFAMGNIAVGAIAKFLPLVLSTIKSNAKRQYLLLHSLKEIITRSQEGSVQPFVSEILPLLFEHSENKEEGVRNVVAECLGKLALVDPANVLPQLKASLAASELKRGTVVTALKYTISEHPQPIDALLATDIPQFLSLLNKAQPVSVRRAAVLVLTTAAHNKPQLIRDNLDSFIPSLYENTILDPSLIREVDLGPFKHRVDDGLELRKAAFECMDTLLDTSLEKLDASAFLSHLRNGLADENLDIRMLAHLMLCKLSVVAPGALLSALETLVEPLKNTATKKAKAEAVQQEKQRTEDVVRSALRAADAIARIPGSEQCALFRGLFDDVIAKDPALKAALDAIHKEHEAQDGMDLS